ncbi:MAG: hypothetical protein R3F61_32580 [Myxococcota bacterium]
MNRIALPTLLLALVATAYAAGGEDPVHRAIRQAVSADPTEQVVGVRELRSRGEDGLHALLTAAEAQRIRATPGQWANAIDQVAAQKDASSSRLFWHTDLDAAKAQALAEGKPILSLRMLGDLRDATSCANSRFFRAILYSNPDLSAFLDEGFVLHWSSERDVPQLTIRYGDGREVHTTVTGNSAHYVLDAKGRPIDVLPGLMTPDTFRAELERAQALYAALEASPDDRAAVLVAHHTAERDAAVARVRFVEPLGLYGAFGTTLPDPATTVLSAPLVAPPSEPRFATDAVPASMAIPIALGKGIVERPFVPVLPPGVGELFGPEDLLVTDEGTLHPASVAFMRSQARDLGTPEGEAVFEAMVERFGKSVRADSTWNRDVLHARIHQWYAQGWSPDFATLNERVYREIFATPASDPWLGLVDPTVYTGLAGGGIVMDGLQAH